MHFLSDFYRATSRILICQTNKNDVFLDKKKQCSTWLATMAFTMVTANENGQIKHSTNSNEICSSKSVCGFYWELS